MFLVVDANVVMSSLIARSYSLDLLLDGRLVLTSPEFMKTETASHFDESREIRLD